MGERISILGRGNSINEGSEVGKNTCFFSFYLLNFLFCIAVQLINNVVIVSDEQQRDSAINIHVSILPQTPLPSRLPHNMNRVPYTVQYVLVG